jgi:hypothetical protein
MRLISAIFMHRRCLETGPIMDYFMLIIVFLDFLTILLLRASFWNIDFILPGTIACFKASPVLPVRAHAMRPCTIPGAGNAPWSGNPSLKCTVLLLRI